jgi:hypothetical protein
MRVRELTIRRLFGRVLGGLLALNALSGCVVHSVGSLPKYSAPAAGSPAATIEVGAHGHVWYVDGSETPPFAKVVRVSPGEHRVGLNCLSFEIVSVKMAVAGGSSSLIPIVDSKSALHVVMVSGPFLQEKKYYARCISLNGEPRAWLADAPDGVDVPQGFAVTCVQGCLN